MVVRVAVLHELLLPTKSEPVREVSAPPPAPAAERRPTVERTFSSKNVNRVISELSPRSPAKRTTPKRDIRAAAVHRSPAHSPAKLRVATRSERQTSMMRGLPARSPKPLSSGSGSGSHAAGNARQYAMLSRRAQQVVSLIGSHGPASSLPQSPLRALHPRNASTYRTMTTSGCDGVVNTRRNLYPALSRPRSNHLGVHYAMPSMAGPLRPGRTAALVQVR